METELTEAQKTAFKPSGNVDTGIAKSTLGVSDKAVNAIRASLAKRGTPEAALRVGIKGGGCSGFSYVIEFADESRRVGVQCRIRCEAGLKVSLFEIVEDPVRMVEERQVGAVAVDVGGR